VATPVCTKCGVALSATARFCPSCGTSVLVASRSTERPMVGIVLVALLLGAMSGALAATIVGVLLQTGQESQVPLITLVLAWAGTSIYLIRSAYTVGAVIRLGALIGAVEWLLFGLVGAMSVTAAMQDSDGATSTAAAIGTGLGIMTVGAITIAMVLVCLLVYGIARFAQREASESRRPT
jgi:hypothetical protein